MNSDVAGSEPEIEVKKVDSIVYLDFGLLLAGLIVSAIVFSFNYIAALAVAFSTIGGFAGIMVGYRVRIEEEAKA